MSQGAYNAIGILILKFRDFLEWIIEPKKQSNSEKLTKFNEILIEEYNLSVFDLFESNFNELEPKLVRINLNILEDTVLSIYENTHEPSKSKIIIKLKSYNNLYSRLLELVCFIESKNRKLSLRRNNIKNSLLHKISQSEN